MAVKTTVFVPAKYVENVQSGQYTCPSSALTAIIDKFTVTNISSSNRAISVNLVASGDGAGTDNLIVKSRILAPSETYTFPMVVGHTLKQGDYISTIADDVNSLVIYVSGREIT